MFDTFKYFWPLYYSWTAASTQFECKIRIHFGHKIRIQLLIIMRFQWTN